MQFQDVVGFDNGIEAVKLVRYRGGEDCLMGVIADGMWEVVVLFRIFYEKIAQALYMLLLAFIQSANITG
jgi:hypothetical protein